MNQPKKVHGMLARDMSLRLDGILAACCALYKSAKEYRCLVNGFGATIRLLGQCKMFVLDNAPAVAYN